MNDEQPKYELITYDGHNEKYVGKKVRLYPDGTIKNLQGRWVERPPGSAEIINSDNARALSLRRQEKTAEKLREAITEAHNSVMPRMVGNTSEAFAMSGAMLYEQVVLDSEKYPRDRLEAWERLGKYAEVLSVGQKQQQEADNDSTLAALGAELVRHLTDRARLARDDS